MTFPKKIRLQQLHPAAKWAGLLTLALLICTGLQAQEQLNADGGLHRVNYPGTYHLEFRVPNPCPYSFLYLRAEGADGGYRSVTNIFTWNEDIKAKGGEGATAKALFKIGYGSGEIPPGSTLRFIIGEAGQSAAPNGGIIASAGGGGTGVVINYADPSGGAPLDNSSGYAPWYMLLVAGGGGGAWASCCEGRDGNPGRVTTSSGPGFPITNGFSHYEKKDDRKDATGFRDSSDPTNHVYYESAKRNHQAFQNRIPVGGKFGAYGDYKRGGYGFGAGGHGWDYGGGGGGYSGGASGNGGDGGGSFINTGFTVAGTDILIENGTTAGPGNGFVEYQFTNDGLAVLARGHEYGNGEATILRSGAYTLLWQYDGNLVLYGGPLGALWSSATNGRGTSLSFQGDGNLVVYSGGTAIWASGTPDDQHGGKGATQLVLFPDGNLQLVNVDGAVLWQTNTGS